MIEKTDKTNSKSSENKNVMINNQRLNKLKQIKENEMDVIKSQTQQIQRKILDNMLPETFILKFPINKKQKLQLQQQQQIKPGMKRPHPPSLQQRKDKKIRQNQKEPLKKQLYTIRGMSMNGQSTSSSKKTNCIQSRCCEFKR